MKILVVEPKRQPYLKEVENRLEDLQEIVDGYLEVVQPWNDKVLLVCNEEGKITQRHKPNRVIRADGGGEDIIFGTFFLCGYDGCDFSDIPEDLMEKYQNKLAI